MEKAIVFLCLFAATYASLRAGVSKINATLPLGTPLAGYNWGARRVPYWPLPVPREYTTWMEPSVGNLDPIWAKALFIDNGDTQIALATVDAIGSDGTLADLAYAIAVEMGFTLTREQFSLHASHSHSGPGAVSPEFLWAVVPATDLLVPTLQRQLATSIATALVDAQQSAKPAVMNLGVGQLTGVTENRRAPNPWVQKDTIDANLGVIRIDDATTNEPLATVWNFAIHGTCYGPENMKFTAEIMGASSDKIESKIGGVALFINADAGDIAPTHETCDCQNNVCKFTGSETIANAVVQTRNGLTPSDQVTIKFASQIVPFGLTNLNITLKRLENCTRGGPLDICTLCSILDCTEPLALPESWVEENPRFTAYSFEIGGETTVLVSMPGEPLIELGWWVRNDTKALGFDNTFLMGYTNNHMGYFATPNEYDYGGYESELTFWGIGTAQKVRSGAKFVASQVVF